MVRLNRHHSRYLHPIYEVDLDSQVSIKNKKSKCKIDELITLSLMWEKLIPSSKSGESIVFKPSISNYRLKEAVHYRNRRY